MSNYSLSHLDDAALLRRLTVLVARDRATTAALLAHIAEVDARRLYAPAGYPSMFAYCVEELGLSEDAAYRRILTARVARQFPAVLSMLAEGRLHLSAVKILAPHLTSDNAEELLKRAAGLPKSELELLLARRFPLATDRPSNETDARALRPAQVVSAQPTAPEVTSAEQQVPELVEAAVEPSTVTVPAVKVLLHVVIDPATQEKLRYAQSLLSHSIPSGDAAQVLDRALDALIARLEKQKFAKTARPRKQGPRPTVRVRLIPAHVRRAVWARDEGRCTFVGNRGHRCGSRKFLEFDHVDPVARGGRATVDGMRLRCRTHNRVEAERVYGTEFMDAKREAAQQTAAERDMIAGLRGLGVRAREATRALHETETLHDAPLDVRLRAALKSLHVRGVRRVEYGCVANGP